MKQDKMEQSLRRYVDLSSKIRLLSSPKIEDIENADDYRNTLVDNFTEIGEISDEINQILDNTIHPLINSDNPLSEDQVVLLHDFSRALVNTTAINYLDPMLSYKVSNKLLTDAEKKSDDRLMIRALDKVIDSSYILMNLTLRLIPCSDLAYTYRENGMRASMKLLDYLDKKTFASLPDDESKALVLVNSRYINALECHSLKMSTEEISAMLERMEKSLELANDSYYIQAAPNYDWRRHVFRTYQYMISCTEKNNACGISEDCLNRIYEVLCRAEELWHSDEKYYSNLCPRSTMDLYAARVSHLSGHITTEDYKKELRRIQNCADSHSYDVHGIISNIFVMEEYLLAVKESGADDADNEFLNEKYRSLTAYLHMMPKTGSISYAVSVLSAVLKDYVTVPGFSFMDNTARLIAAIHPPTYVHTLTMSSLTTYLTKALMRKRPDLFAEFTDCKEAGSNEKVLEFAEYSSLSHDIGKIFVIEFIMMYGRKLYDDEFKIIQKHSDIGGYVLRQHDITEEYHALATAHHLMFDTLERKASEGMFNHSEIPFIAVALCADGLDAATDTVGRSYKKGKPLEAVIDEFREGSGTRYAPYVVDLFDDSEVINDVRKILNEGREENYRKAYYTLRG